MYIQVLLDKKSIVSPLESSVFQMLKEFIVYDASVVAERSIESAIKAIQNTSERNKWSSLLVNLKNQNRLQFVDKLSRPSTTPYSIYLADRGASSNPPELDNMPISDLIDHAAIVWRKQLTSEDTPIRLFHQSKVRNVVNALRSKTQIPSGTSAENIWLAYFSPFVGSAHLNSSSQAIVLCDRYMLEEGNVPGLECFLERLGAASFNGQVTLVTKYWFDHSSKTLDHLRVESDARKVHKIFCAHGLSGCLVFQDDRILRGLAHGRQLRFGHYGLDLDIGVETFRSPQIARNARIVKWRFDHDRYDQESKFLKEHIAVGGKPASFRKFLLP